MLRRILKSRMQLRNRRLLTPVFPADGDASGAIAPGLTLWGGGGPRTEAKIIS